jgi:hypothetical protein
MPRLMVTVKGTPKDHTHISDDLAQDEATKQLARSSEYVGKAGTLRLPWLVAHGTNILAVQLID